MLTLDDYKKACKIAAKVVEKFGDAYLPVFQRTFEELKKAEARISLKDTAIQMAKDF